MVVVVVAVVSASDTTLIPNLSGNFLPFPNSPKPEHVPFLGCVSERVSAIHSL